MLDARQAFKAAFLHRCLEQGLSLDETHDAVKEACEELEQSGRKEANVWPWLKNNIPGVAAVSGMASGAAQGFASRLPGLAAGAYLGVPIIGGGLAGYGIAKMQGLNDEDPDEIKTQEKIDAYRRAAIRAHLQKKLYGAKNQRRPSRPLL